MVDTQVTIHYIYEKLLLPSFLGGSRVGKFGAHEKINRKKHLIFLKFLFCSVWGFVRPRPRLPFVGGDPSHEFSHWNTQEKHPLKTLGFFLLAVFSFFFHENHLKQPLSNWRNPASPRKYNNTPVNFVGWSRFFSGCNFRCFGLVDLHPLRVKPWASSDRRWHPIANYKVKDLHHKQPAVSSQADLKQQFLQRLQVVVYGGMVNINIFI